MADVTQGAEILIAHRAMTNAATRDGLFFAGTEVDVRTFISADVFVYHAVIEAAANDPGIEYRLQGRWSTDAFDEDWVDLWVFTSGIIASVAAEIAGTEAIGETTIAVDANPTAAFTPGVKCYIQDTTVVADGEWAVVAISATGPDIVTISDGLRNAKDDADTMRTQAETFSGRVDLSGQSFVRMIVSGSDTAGADIHFKSHMVTFTDFE